MVSTQYAGSFTINKVNPSRQANANGGGIGGQQKNYT